MISLNRANGTTSLYESERDYVYKNVDCHAARVVVVRCGCGSFVVTTSTSTRES
jgi:hypothetical protein